MSIDKFKTTNYRNRNWENITLTPRTISLCLYNFSTLNNCYDIDTACRYFNLNTLNILTYLNQITKKDSVILTNYISLIEIWKGRLKKLGLTSSSHNLMFIGGLIKDFDIELARLEKRAERIKDREEYKNLEELSPSFYFELKNAPMDSALKKHNVKALALYNKMKENKK